MWLESCQREISGPDGATTDSAYREVASTCQVLIHGRIRKSSHLTTSTPLSPLLRVIASQFQSKFMARNQENPPRLGTPGSFTMMSSRLPQPAPPPLSAIAQEGRACRPQLCARSSHLLSLMRLRLAEATGPDPTSWISPHYKQSRGEMTSKEIRHMDDGCLIKDNAYSF